MSNWPAPLAEISGTSIQSPWPTLGALFADCAERFPDTVLVDCFEDGEQVTYLEFDRRSNSLSRGLVSVGASKGTMIATMLPNTIHYPLVWAAISKLGALMAPVAPTYTATELAFILKDSDASHLIIDTEHLPLLDSLPTELEGVRVIVTGSKSDEAQIAFEDLYDHPDLPIDQENLDREDVVGLQYTSGTTGSPKGCMVTHEYWMLLGRSVSKHLRAPVRRILSPHQFHYMNGRNLLVTAMDLGATLYLGRRPSSSRFLSCVYDLEIDFCFFPQIMLSRPAEELERTTPLKEVAMGAATADLQREFTRRFGVPAFDLYGMTEAGAIMAGDTTDPRYWGSGSMGVEMLGRAVTIRDNEGNEVPVGVEGELWVTGPGMMKGYFGRPDADAEIFRGKWLRTGDLVVRKGDGLIYFLRRIKDIVRRSNENISAREVEGVARLHEAVLDAAVVPEPDADRGEEVKIFIELRPDYLPDAALVSSIHETMSQNIARFKCPRYYAFVAALPRTPSLKISKGELRAGKYPTVWQYDRERS